MYFVTGRPCKALPDFHMHFNIRRQGQTSIYFIERTLILSDAINIVLHFRVIIAFLSLQVTKCLVLLAAR